MRRRAPDRRHVYEPTRRDFTRSNLDHVSASIGIQSLREISVSGSSPLCIIPWNRSNPTPSSRQTIG